MRISAWSSDVWSSYLDATRAVPAEIRLYDRLFSVARPDDESDGKTYRDHINPDSRTVVQGYVEPAAVQATPETRFQFERTGYFVADRLDHVAGTPVFNRAVTLPPTWMQQGHRHCPTSCTPHPGPSTAKRR